MTRAEKISCVLMVVYAIIVVLAVMATPAHGQELTLAPVKSAEEAKPGDVVMRRHNVEVRKVYEAPALTPFVPYTAEVTVRVRNAANRVWLGPLWGK